jgi:hypothetical protein
MAAASCYCGDVRASFDPVHAFALHCHCSQCRRLSGAAFTTWLNVSRAGFRLEAGEGSLTAFSVTSNATRYFCKHCGAHVYSTDIRDAAIVGLPLGIVTGDYPSVPKTHYYFDSGVPWCDVDASTRKMGGQTGHEPLDD